MLLKNNNIISKIKISKVTNYAALKDCFENVNIYLRNKDTQQMKNYFWRSYMSFDLISFRMFLLTINGM